jgi:hypothetical protein
MGRGPCRSKSSQLFYDLLCVLIILIQRVIPRRSVSWAMPTPAGWAAKETPTEPLIGQLLFLNHALFFVCSPFFFSFFL